MLKTATARTRAAAVAAGKGVKKLGDNVSATLLRDDERLKEEQERAEVEAGFVKMRTKNSKSDPAHLRHLRCVQELSGDHTGAVWTMKFSSCGRLLATAGQDKIVRVWVIKEYLAHFQAMRNEDKDKDLGGEAGAAASEASAADDAPPSASASSPSHLFHPVPFCQYTAHKSDVLDLSWSLSRNYFLLSSSMDKTVRLWHISRSQCLACFLHDDFVTAIAFHPRNDKYFLSGSLDCKLRLWNIPEKKVALWNELGSQGCNLITSANFCSRGKYAVAGTYDGRCVFFNTEERLKYHTQIHARSTRGKNSKGRKISGIEPMPGSDKILVTSNDSRIRLCVITPTYPRAVGNFLPVRSRLARLCVARSLSPITFPSARPPCLSPPRAALSPCPSRAAFGQHGDTPPNMGGWSPRRRAQECRAAGLQHTGSRLNRQIAACSVLGRRCSLRAGTT